MKNPCLIFLICLFIFGVNTDISAQRKGKKKKRPEKTEQVETSERVETSDRIEKITPSFKDRMNYELKAGNISLGNQLRFALKGNAGFKLNEHFTGGLAIKYDFSFINFDTQEDINFSHYGGGPFVRGKFLNDFYIQVEYDYFNMQKIQGGFVFLEERVTAFAPLIGGGYFSGFGDWRFGAEILFIANDDVRNNLSSAIEYWFGASYNF